MNAVNNALKHIATLWVAGFVPPAPGTVGTLVAVLAVALLRLPAPFYLLVTAVVVVVGTIASDVVEGIMGRKDPGCIVIDEFAGYMVSMAFLPHKAGYLFSAFILFRLFDILKPPPISWLQNLKGGLGVMADDLAAGLLTNVVLQLWRVLIQK